MANAYIKVQGASTAIGHITEAAFNALSNPLTSSSGDKVWHRLATITGADDDLHTDPAYDVENGTITHPYKSLADCKAAKLAQLAEYRYEQEIGGIAVSSVPVATDRDSQSLMTAARIIAKEDSEYTVNWKGESGFVSLNATQIIAIADAVRGHVQDCFDNEKAHSDAINALTTAASVDAYDITTGW